MDTRPVFRYTMDRKGGAAVKVEWRQVPEREEPVLVVESAHRTPQVEELLQALRGTYDAPLTGWQGDRAVLLDPGSLVRIYAQDKGVFAQDSAGQVYALKLRLYELEERLDGRSFVRVSNSEIVNLKQVTALDLSLSGTIKLTLTGGGVSWVSRRSVKNIKKALGL